MGACLSKEEAAARAQVATPATEAPAPASSAPPDPTATPEQPTNGDAAPGWAYQGAPRPANDSERLGVLRALGVLDSEQGPDQFDAITRLLCAVFNVPIALVSLVDAERQWFKSVQGMGSCLQTAREESFCAWTLLPESPYVLIVEDTLEDKRFRENPLVKNAPHIRFYAGAPLISSANGYRYGTLCVIDTKPHFEFAAEQYNMLIQFAELCVREIEKDKLTTLQKLVQQAGRSEGSMSPLASLRTSTAASVTPSMLAAADHSGGGGSGSVLGGDAAIRSSAGGGGADANNRSSANGVGGVAGNRSSSSGEQHWGLTRAVDCFREGVMLVDASSPTWAVLYTNDAFTASSGMPRDEATAQGFWEMFGSPGLGPASFQESVEANEPFTLTVNLQTIYSTSPRQVAVDFRPAGGLNPADDVAPVAMLPEPRRPAATGQLGGHSQLIGIPASVSSAAAAAAAAAGEQEVAASAAMGPKYYFGILRSEARKSPTSLPAQGSLGAQPPMTAAAALAPGGGGGNGGSSMLPSPLASSTTTPAGARTPTGAAAGGGDGTGQSNGGGSGGQGQGAAYNTSRASIDSERSMASNPGMGTLGFKRAMPSAFTDVRLGPLIGRGAYGRVYRGSWNGTTVAVKVIETIEALDEAGLAPGKNGIFEAVLSSNLSHPNIVHTYQYAFRPVTVDEGNERMSGDSRASSIGRQLNPASKPANEVWLVSEFCNRGPLLTAIERGAFLTQPSSQYGQPNLISVLQTLQEIAAALQYLHRNDVLHGDLTGGNVLLTASDKDTRGFSAKVVDFGLSRVCSEDYLRTRTLGCAEYMPPELITEGILTKAADVYAFGVITWEMYVGRRAWDGLKPTEVLRKVASNTRLDFPQQTPHRLKVLGDRCMEYAPASRPTMDEVLSEVNSILADTMGILQQFLAASTAAAVGGGAARGALGSGVISDLPPSDPFR